MVKAPTSVSESLNLDGSQGDEGHYSSSLAEKAGCGAWSGFGRRARQNRRKPDPRRRTERTKDLERPRNRPLGVGVGTGSRRLRRRICLQRGSGRRPGPHDPEWQGPRPDFEEEGGTCVTRAPDGQSRRERSPGVRSRRQRGGKVHRTGASCSGCTPTGTTRIGPYRGTSPIPAVETGEESPKPRPQTSCQWRLNTSSVTAEQSHMVGSSHTYTVHTYTTQMYTTHTPRRLYTTSTLLTHTLYTRALHTVLTYTAHKHHTDVHYSDTYEHTTHGHTTHTLLTHIASSTLIPHPLPSPPPVSDPFATALSSFAWRGTTTQDVGRERRRGVSGHGRGQKTVTQET